MSRLGVVAGAERSAVVAGGVGGAAGGRAPAARDAAYGQISGHLCIKSNTEGDTCKILTNQNVFFALMHESGATMQSITGQYLARRLMRFEIKNLSKDVVAIETT
uniref:Beta-lactamase domain-containing protein n=1 Tax=Angiostrongylus cantonensis TaxID=6313 RepID=A0A0K0DC06_ANGCA